MTASAETGYTLAVGQSGSEDNPTRYFIEPQAQVTWMGVKADDLTEDNGTRVSSQGNDNIQTRLGVRAFMQGHSRMDNGKNRTFQPFVEVNWLHNTKRNGVTMNGVSLEQAGATNIGEMKLGVEGQLSKQTALWGGVGQQIGDKGYSNTTATLGVKYSF
ncbi:autotransporter outer membrane beta-barrel domain-containing protein [Serratia rhizosphaerae]|uniref:autotransporter outer membrane beta-barrel domain-containing protein n=1 Tax=Serratia rhizosphaerae TaxID=2597702 RepID=UPI002DBE8E67|nr:autotransporter outer membrane beta-barrel domain-containing protein [Serratia rhizosphaerae]